MKNIVDRLAECEQISEWIGINDPRLTIATGEPAPNRGAQLRESWEAGLSPKRLVAEVSRLIVPTSVELVHPVTATFDADVRQGKKMSRVCINFASSEDWLRCFPLGNESSMTFGDDDWTVWAGVATCSGDCGLAVFAQQDMEVGETVEARIQPVPNDIFKRIAII